ncbi:MAG: DUF4363 family protein [Clostridiales bacterium]|nr:DUF4363 family protein [Clostridiales bacterium]
MKVSIITLIILVLFFGGAIYGNIYINNSADQLTYEIEKLDESIDELNWDEAKIHMEGIMDNWQKIKKIWLTILEHEEVNNIDLLLGRLKRYVEIEESNDATSEIAALKLLIQHTTEKGSFKLVNIL